MAFAPERARTAAFLRQLAREREEYAMPPRLRELAERFAHRTLALLFPHFAAEVGGRAGDVAEELARWRRCWPTCCGCRRRTAPSPDAVVERFFAALPDIREALLLDAQAICDGDPAAHSDRRGDPRLPGLLRHRRLPARASAAGLRGAARAARC